MSTNLFWKPAPVKPEGTSLPKTLKFAISKKYWDHDGSLSGCPILIDRTDYSYFEGLRDAGTEGASEILEAIDKYGEIEITLE